MRGRGTRSALAATAAAVATLIAGAGGAQAASQAVAYQLDAAHSGYSADAGVAPPWRCAGRSI